MVRILIGGDLCPVGLNMPFFEVGDVSTLFGKFALEFQKADLSVVNLECPLIVKETPIKKIGPVLSSSQKCINGIKTLGVDVVNLGNNHIMDHGIQGLQSTIAALQDKEIAYVGVGKNLEKARSVLIRHVKGMRIGILSVAEHEFSIATREKPGANPWDIIDFLRTVQEHSADWDHLIVLFHGGSEFYQYPSPWLKKMCRFIVEQGANAVICQHSHCAGCMEVYKGAPIVYGQGNLLFCKHLRQNPIWYKELLLSLYIDSDRHIQVELIPLKQIHRRPGIHEMSEGERTTFLAGFNDRSKIIGDDEKLKALWNKFCSQQRNLYLRCLYGNYSFFGRALTKAQLLGRFYSKRKRCLSLGAIQCESHREALLNILAENT